MMNTVTNLRFRNIGITLLLLLVLFVLARFWLRPSPHIRKRANVAFKAPGDDAKNVALKDGALPQHEEVDKPIYVAPKPPADNPNMMQRLLDQLPNFGGDPDSEEALFEFQDDLPNVPIPPPSKEEFNEKWIVITTINKPTEDVKQLAAIKGWNMVIVADTKTPTDYDTLFEHGDNVHFLSVEEQESPSLDYSIKEHVPWKVYGRKNLGYLYAIQRGAKVIYETDDDNHPTDGMESFCINSTTWTGMIVNTSNHNYNPYAFFGQTSLWPRGFQLDFVSKPNKNRFRLCTMKAPAVQQGVVNGDPDMGAMFRLTRKIETRIINVTFDYASPPFSYPQNVFSPYNSQNTVSLYTAFWGLLMPNTVTFRVTDIWRSYFTTRLLWLLDERVAFSPPSAFQLRSAHSYLVDASQEPDLYFKTEAFLQFLSGWDCDGGRLFRECIVMLAMDMAMHEKKFWGVKDVRFIMAWLSDLERIGYKFPERANLGNTTAVCEQTTILYHAREQKTSFPSTTSNQLIPSTSHVAREAKVLSEVCPALNVGIGKLASSDLYTSLYPASKTGLEDVLLIVRVRSAHVTGMAALDTFYRRDFYQIVFCVEEKMLEDAAKLNRSVITIPDSSDPLLDFKCVTTAILMKYRVTGYLYLDSETLLRYWAAADLPKDKLWVDDASVNSIPEVKVGDSCLNDPLTNPDAAKSFPNFKVLYVPQSVASTVINLSTPFKDVSAMRVNFYKAIACHHKKDINQVVLVSKQDPTKLEPPTTTAPTTTPQQQPQQQQPQQQQQQQPQQQQAQQQQPQQQQAQQQQAQQQQPQQQQAQQQQQPQQQQVDKANQGGETKVEPVKEESVKTRRLLAVESPKQSLQYEIFNFQEVGSNPKVKEIYCFLIDSTTVKS